MEEVFHARSAMEMESEVPTAQIQRRTPDTDA